MITLCLDTSSGPCSIAVSRDGQLLAETLLATIGKRQNAWLLAELERLLTAAELSISQIDLFACSAGPGSFTGVRTGVATIQGLALAHDKPCVGFSSLALLAMNLPFALHPVCSLLDARKNEVYAGLYRSNDLPEPLMQECAIAPALLLEQLDGTVIFTGDGAVRYRDQIIAAMGNKALFAPLSHSLSRASHGLPLAESLLRQGRAVSPDKLLPNYLRLSEAELSRQQKI